MSWQLLLSFGPLGWCLLRAGRAALSCPSLRLCPAPQAGGGHATIPTKDGAGMGLPGVLSCRQRWWGSRVQRVQVTLLG